MGFKPGLPKFDISVSFAAACVTLGQIFNSESQFVHLFSREEYLIEPVWTLNMVDMIIN